MPSPVGHSLAALAVGWSVWAPPAGRRARVIQIVTLMAIGCAPDLDLIIGRHSQETHSVGAALTAGILAAILRLPIASTRWRIGVVAALAWATHPLLDMLGDDSSVPIGVMALWPFSTDYYHAGLRVFDSFYRNWRAAGFITHNAAAMAREVVFLLPVALAVWWLRNRRSEIGNR